MLKAPDSQFHTKGMLHTCLDETGKWKDSSVSFAGWISDLDSWHTFQEEWGAVLAEFPGITSIHMSTLMLANGDKKYQDHEFTEARPREKMVNKLVDVIHKNTLAYVACGVDCEAYRRVVSTRAQKRIGKTAHVFVFRLMKHVVETLVTLKWPWATGLIFDDNRGYGVECYQHYSHARELHQDWNSSFGSIAFADDEIYTPLQSADVLAWFLRKRMEPQYDGRFERTIKRLMRNKRGIDNYYDEASLKELNEKLLVD